MSSIKPRRILYVHVYPSPLFAAHWSFWIPHMDNKGKERDTGHRIHVTGDRLNGFTYEYIQDYNPREDDRTPNAFAIGALSAASLSGLDSKASDAAACLNAFDKACREVEAPGPSLNKVVPNAAGGTGGVVLPRKREVRDCQWWIRQAVGHLVTEGLLLSLEDASSEEKVGKLPKH